MTREPLRQGFTFIEFVVLLAIVGSLAALIAISVQSSRGAARRTQCQARLQQIGIGFQAFESAQRRLPGDGHSFHVQLLPYLDKPALHDLREQDPESLRPIHLPLFTCPSDKKHRTKSSPVRTRTSRRQVTSAMPAHGLPSPDSMECFGMRNLGRPWHLPIFVTDYRRRPSFPNRFELICPGIGCG